MSNVFVLKNTDMEYDIINWATNNIGPQSGNTSVVEAHGWYYASNVNVAMNTATLVSGGTGTYAAGFSPGQILQPSGAGTTYSLANLAIQSVTMGTCNVITGGNNYTIGDTFTWAFPAPGTPAIVTVATANAIGAISTVTITNPGAMYNWNITNTTAFNTQVTHNANCTTATFNMRWDANTVTVNAKGDYASASSNPTSFTATTGSGTGLTASVAWLNRNSFTCNNASDFNSFVVEWDWVRYGGGAPISTNGQFN